jgi:hypothetical protein
MPVFFILFLIGLIILWFLLSPLFVKIGEIVINVINKVFSTDEINNKEEKETKR